MKKENRTFKNVPGKQRNVATVPIRRKKGNGPLGRLLRRFLLVLAVAVLLLLGDFFLVLNLVFNGPSLTARNQLTMALIEASATKWVPALFIGEDTVAEIRAGVHAELEDALTDTSAVIINRGNQAGSDSEWVGYPDGIRIEDVHGRTYNAKVMLVRDPAQVYLGISTHNGFSTSIPGKRLTAAMADEGAIAGINGGAFNDDGTTGSYVGTLPAGLVYSDGECVWTSGKPTETSGFAGFTRDNILVVSTENLSKAQAEKLNIRDGCCFGPVLIMNGQINMEEYNKVAGLNPRTAIGQRADGTVIFVCIDGRQPSSMGGEYKDAIDIMVEYGAVNACNMDGGSSTVMMYRDTYGRYGDSGEVRIMNSYSLLQSEPRKMPDFWMVRPAGGK